jgi:hypothetical protein
MAKRKQKNKTSSEVEKNSYALRRLLKRISTQDAMETLTEGKLFWELMDLATYLIDKARDVGQSKIEDVEEDAGYVRYQRDEYESRVSELEDALTEAGVDIP